MYIKNALINDHLIYDLRFCSDTSAKFVILLESSLLSDTFYLRLNNLKTKNAMNGNH